MEEVIWNIHLGKFDLRWVKYYSSPLFKWENRASFTYLGVYKLALVVFKKP